MNQAVTLRCGAGAPVLEAVVPDPAVWQVVPEKALAGLLAVEAGGVQYRAQVAALASKLGPSWARKQAAQGSQGKPFSEGLARQPSPPSPARQLHC